MPEFQDFLQRLLEGDAVTRAPDYGWTSLALSLLLGLFLGQLVAWVYSWTHSGLSYSRSFTQSLVLLMVLSALVMYVIADSLVTAFGLIGALAIIRFRNVLKDTRDTVFVFSSLVLGMACGSQRYTVAVFGTLFLLAITIYLHFVTFGTRGRFDGHLTYRVGRDPGGVPQEALTAIIRRFCRRIREITRHDEGEVLEYIYEVRLRNRDRSDEFVDEIRDLAGVRSVHLSLRDPHAEL